MKIAYAVLLLALLAPATASAQTPPPDERAAARAFADAAGRYADAIEAPTASFFAFMAHPARRPPGCPKVAKKHGDDAFLLVFINRTFEWLRDIKPATQAMRTELANVTTTDPVLVSGRAAWRANGRYIARAPEPIDVCAMLRAWRRADYPRSMVRGTLGGFKWADEPGRSAERKLDAAVDRMVGLGVSREQASLFSNPFPEPDGMWKGS